jgi:hypothetical protein
MSDPQAETAGASELKSCAKTKNFSSINALPRAISTTLKSV